MRIKCQNSGAHVAIARISCCLKSFLAVRAQLTVTLKESLRWYSSICCRNMSVIFKFYFII